MAELTHDSLTLPELQSRAREYAKNLHYLDASEHGWAAVIEAARAVRQQSADRRDALKWTAAFAVGSLLAVGQLIRGSDGGVRAADAIGLLAAQGAFLTSLVGSA